MLNPADIPLGPPMDPASFRKKLKQRQKAAAQGGSSSLEQKKKPAKETEVPAIPFSIPHFSMDVSQRRDGGVMKIVQRMGVGDEDDIPGFEDHVTVHYVAVMHNGERDGEKFESTRDKGQPLSFIVTKTKGVVPGLHQAVKTMRRREIATFFFRTDYGYSKRGCPTLDVPSKQHLMYEIELLEYHGEDISPEEDGSVLKSIMRKGTGYLFLPIGSQLHVSIKGRHKGRLFDSRMLTFELGVGDEQGIPEGVEQTCQRMIPGEKARVIIQPSYSYGIEFDKFGVPKTETVEYEVELLNYQKPPEHFEVSAFGKLEQAKIAKDKGAHYFSKGRYKQALNHYENVLNYVEHDPDFFDVDKTEHAEFHKERAQVLQAGRLNCAICYLKLKKLKSAVKQCDLILQKLDAKCVKAHYRRGLANLGLGRLYEARDDFQTVLDLEPGNTSARRELHACLTAIDQAKRREKALCETMFKRPQAAAAAAAIRRQSDGNRGGDVAEPVSDQPGQPDADEEQATSASSDVESGSPGSRQNPGSPVDTENQPDAAAVAPEEATSAPKPELTIDEN